MTNGRDALSKSETLTIAAIEKGVPLLVEAREIIIAFHAMIRKKTHVDLDHGWNEHAQVSSHPSPTASPKTRPPSALRLQHLGLTGRPKVRLPSSSSSSVRCTGAPSSIFFRRA
jgi:hypothetical protein